MISAITSVNGSILTHSADPSSMSVAQRMSWASNRQTTRVEDQAYSLLGIFNVSIPMLYGEGSKAFIRLQEEILKTYTDHSIFAWEFDEKSPADGSLLAASPLNFAHSGKIVQLSKPGAFEMTNRGLRISLRTIECISDHAEILAILKCRYMNDLSRILALRLQKYGGGQEYHAINHTLPHHDRYEPHTVQRSGRTFSRLMVVHAEDLELAKEPSLLQITREFEAEASKLKFWVPMTTGEFHIVETHPKKSWDPNDGIMHSSEEQRVRGAVTIETSLGNRFVLAFGFDRLIKRARKADRVYELAADESQNRDATESINDNQHADDDQHPSRVGVQASSRVDGQNHNQEEYSQDDLDGIRKFLPGIWGSTWNSLLSPHDSFQRLVATSNTDCQHDTQSCANHACPFMPAFTQIHEFKVSERLEARIRTEKIMEDTVFRIDVTLAQMHEFEAVEYIFELMGVPITVSKSFADQASLKQLIIPSIVPSLQHELTINELGSPIQVWMRLPRAIGVSATEERSFRVLSHRTLFWSFQEPGIIAQSIKLTTPSCLSSFSYQSANLPSLYRMGEYVELFFVGDLFRGWEISALSSQQDSIQAHLDELRDRVQAKDEIGKNPYRDQRLSRTVSTSISLPICKKILWARMRHARTGSGIACVIDLHLEDMEAHLVKHAVTLNSPKIEYKESRRNLTVLQDFNEAMSGVQDIEPNQKRWGYVGLGSAIEPSIDILEMQRLREAQHIGIKSLSSRPSNVGTADIGEELGDVLRHMAEVSEEFPSISTSQSIQGLKPEITDHDEEGSKPEISTRPGAESPASERSWSSIQDSNTGWDEDSRFNAGLVQIWLRAPQGMELISSHPASSTKWPDNTLSWNAQDCRSALGGVILRSTRGSEALLAFVGNDEDSLDISVWKTSAYTDLAQTCASLRAKPAGTWRSPFLEANLFGSRPGDSSTLYFPSEKALFTAELQRAEVDGRLEYTIDVSLDSQEWGAESATSDTTTWYSTSSSRRNAPALSASDSPEEPLDGHHLERPSLYSELRERFRRLGHDR